MGKTDSYHQTSSTSAVAPAEIHAVVDNLSFFVDLVAVVVVSSAAAAVLVSATEAWTAQHRTWRFPALPRRRNGRSCCPAASGHPGSEDEGRKDWAPRRRSKWSSERAEARPRPWRKPCSAAASFAAKTGSSEVMYLHLLLILLLLVLPLLLLQLLWKPRLLPLSVVSETLLFHTDVRCPTWLCT